MLACLGYIVPYYFKFPGELSPSSGLTFEDIPQGLAALSKAVPRLHPAGVAAGLLHFLDGSKGRSGLSSNATVGDSTVAEAARKAEEHRLAKEAAEEAARKAEEEQVEVTRLTVCIAPFTSTLSPSLMEAVQDLFVHVGGVPSHAEAPQV